MIPIKTKPDIYHALATDLVQDTYMARVAGKNPLDVESYMARVAKAVRKLVERAATKIVEAESVASSAATLKLRDKQIESLKAQMADAKQAAHDARCERDRQIKLKQQLEHRLEALTKERKQEHNHSQERRDADMLTRLTQKLNEANHIAGGLREENQRMARELVELRSMQRPMRKLVDEMPERVAKIVATHPDMIRSEA